MFKEQEERLDWPYGARRSEFFRQILHNETLVTNGPPRMHGSSFNLSSKFLLQRRWIQHAWCIRENADTAASQEFRDVCVVPQRTL